MNACWVFGALIAVSVLRGFLDRTDEWAYRIPFALQWAWPIPIFIGAYIAPESPWWLVRQGRIEKAKTSLRRLESVSDSVEESETIAIIVHTNALEKEYESGTTYWDCFKGVNLRRTEITCLVWVSQTLCGAGLSGYSTYFYIQAGLNPEMSFNMTRGQMGLGLFGVLLAWTLMAHFGRRPLWIGGLVALFALLMIIGFLSIVRESSANSWAISSMLLIFTFVYDATTGPICYSLVTEMPSTRLRTKTVVLARTMFNITCIINGLLFPRMLNPTSWNWRGKTGFFWAGFCALCTIWAYFRLPEPKGRTYGELDVLFESRVSARKFVDPFHGSAVQKTGTVMEQPEDKQ